MLTIMQLGVPIKSVCLYQMSRAKEDSVTRMANLPAA
jgi:hypothetical protein